MNLPATGVATGGCPALVGVSMVGAVHWISMKTMISVETNYYDYELMLVLVHHYICTAIISLVAT
jgi:hypothetical protein